MSGRHPSAAQLAQMSDAEFASVVEWHSPNRPDDQGMRWCLVCDEDWPCVSARIAPPTPVPPADPSF